MKRIIRLLCISLLLPACLQAAPALDVSLDKAEIEYGRSINLIVKASGITDDLNKIDLSPLDKHFHIDVTDYSSIQSPLSAGDSQQVLRLHLTPRTTGVLPLPGLEFSNLTSSAREISVTAGRAQGKTLNVVLHVGKQEIWARQQYTIWVEVTTPDKFASLRANELVIPGFKLVPLRAERVQAQRQGDLTLLRAGWLLYTNKAGDHDITLPSIDYLLGGDVERQYYLPAQTIHVKALPPYIPPTMPVGRIAITERLLPGRFLQKDSLARWQIEMRSADVRPEDFPPILRQIKSTADLVVLPAEIHREMQAVSDGNNSLVSYAVPVKPQNNTLFTLPELRVQYFDPDSGKITTHQPVARTVLSLSMPIWIVILILTIYASWKTGKATISMFRQHMTKRKAISCALMEIDKSENVDELRRALRAYAAARGWSANIALANWPGHWHVKTNKNEIFSQSLWSLSYLSYGRNAEGHDFGKTRSLLLSALTD